MKIAVSDERLYCLLSEQIEPFLGQLRAARYVDQTLKRKRAILSEFALWARQENIVANDLNNDKVADRWAFRSIHKVPHRVGTRHGARFS